MLEPIMFCLWLVPAQPAYVGIADHIDHLAAQYRAPQFLPHLTLFCGKTTDKAQMLADVRKIIAQTPSITLSVTGVGASSEYYKSVFVTFSDTPALNNLFQQVKTELDPQSHYTLKPHMSLLYQDLPLAKKQSIAAEVQSKLTVKNITFNQIQVISVTDQQGPDAVKSWQSWYKGDLRSSGS